MTAPAHTEPAFLTAARLVTIAVASCTHCGAIPGDNCLEMLPGHVHYARLSRARCQREPLLPSGLFQDTLNSTLSRTTAEDFGPGSDV